MSVLRKMLAVPLLLAALLLAAVTPGPAHAQGGTPSGDAAAVCASPGANDALVSMCALYTGGTLPDAAQADLGQTIVKLWKSLQQPAQVSTPEEACALEPAPHPAVPVLCRLWKTGVLPLDARDSIGHIVVRLVNGKFEVNRMADARAREAKAAGAARLATTAGAPGLKPAKPVDTTAYLEKCKAFLAEHPDDQGEKVQYCRRVVAGEVVAPPQPGVTGAKPAATVTATATPTPKP